MKRISGLDASAVGVPSGPFSTYLVLSNEFDTCRRYVLPKLISLPELESRFQIVFDKLSEVRPEQWEPAQSEAEVQALRKANEEIAELARELLEIAEPPASLFTTT